MECHASSSSLSQSKYTLYPPPGINIRFSNRENLFFIKQLQEYQRSQGQPGTAGQPAAEDSGEEQRGEKREEEARGAKRREEFVKEESSEEEEEGLMGNKVWSNPQAAILAGSDSLAFPLSQMPFSQAKERMPQGEPVKPAPGLSQFDLEQATGRQGDDAQEPEQKAPAQQSSRGAAPKIQYVLSYQQNKVIIDNKIFDGSHQGTD